MKKSLILVALGAVVVGAAVAARKFASTCSNDDRRAAMWDRMRRHMEEMPEDFPPRIMFDNVQRARENTDQILEILEKPVNERESDLIDASV